jgi:tetratricopeptide (TPR) repeat protein
MNWNLNRLGISVALLLVLPLPLWGQRIVRWERRDYRNEGDRLVVLGHDALRSGNPLGAIAVWKRANSYYQRVNDQLAYSRTLGLIASTYTQLRSNNEATQQYMGQLRFANTLGDTGAKVVALNQLATLALRTDNANQALVYSQAALTLAAPLELNLATADALQLRGRIAANYGKTLDALRFYYTSIPLRYPVGDRRGEGYTYLLSGDAQLAQEDYRNAVLDYGMALSTGKILQDRTLMSLASDRLIAAYLQQPRPNEFRVEDLLQNRTSLALIQGDLPTAIASQQFLGDLYQELGFIAKARLAYQQAYDLALSQRDLLAQRQLYFRLRQVERDYP